MGAPKIDPRIMDELRPSECVCDWCVSACSRPCWPSPAEALALVDSGHASWATDEGRSAVARWRALVAS